jgi:hypothetical protein
MNAANIRCKKLLRISNYIDGIDMGARADPEIKLPRFIRFVSGMTNRPLFKLPTEDAADAVSPTASVTPDCEELTVFPPCVTPGLIVDGPGVVVGPT